MRTLTIVMYLAVIVAALAVTWNALGGPSRSASSAQQGSAGEEYWQGWEELKSFGHPKGSAEAPAVIIEFVDYQCPYCQRLAPILDSLVAVYETNLQVFSVPFPLPQHRFGEATAVAAHCAAWQDQFPGMYSALFALKDSIGLIGWNSVAERAGITDVDQFESCMSSGAAETAVREAAAVGRSVGVTGTPTLVLNGRRLRTRLEFADLRQAIDSVLSGDFPVMSDTVNVTQRAGHAGASQP